MRHPGNKFGPEGDFDCISIWWWGSQFKYFPCCPYLWMTKLHWKSDWQSNEVAPKSLRKVMLLPPFSLIRRLWKTKHPRKRFQSFRQSFMLLTDWIEIHQLQPLVWPSNLLRSCYRAVVGGFGSDLSITRKTAGRKFWKRFRGCFVFQSCASKKTVVTR